MGIHVVMLTGDNERTAKAIGEQAGVDEVIAGVLPEGKEQVIRKLKEKGKVAMVGDGIRRTGTDQGRYGNCHWSGDRYCNRCSGCCAVKSPVK